MVIRKQNSTTPETRKNRSPFTALKIRKVTVLRNLNMEHLKFHLILEWGKKREGNGTNESNGAKRS
jgi:hypothetical protein